MRIARLGVKIGIHGDPKFFADPGREFHHQGYLLCVGEPQGKGSIEFPGYHCIASATVCLNRIPEIFPTGRGTSVRKDERERGNMLLQVIVRDETRAEISHCPGRPIGACGDGRPPLCSPDRQHR